MSNDSARVRVIGPEAGEPESDPLLPVSRKELVLTRTGNMEAEGVRERTPVKVSEFESQYRQPEDKTPVLTKLKEAIAKRRAKFSFQRALVSNFPILSALKKYKPLRDLPNDVVAGLTAGIMMIPQGGNAFCSSISLSSLSLSLCLSLCLSVSLSLSLSVSLSVSVSVSVSLSLSGL